MKKLLVFLICMLTALALTGCEEEHKHNYTVRNVSFVYFVREADCENAATYFYACACGEKGAATFTTGNPLGHRDADDNLLCDRCGASYTDGKDSTEHTHEYNQTNVDDEYLAISASCENMATYYYSCSCGEKGTATFTTGNPLGHRDADDNSLCDRCSDSYTDGKDIESGALLYELSADSSFYYVTGFDGRSANIEIPKTYNGLRVKGIKSNAFKDCVYLESITLPNTVEEIGDYAFFGCKSLKSISMPYSVAELGAFAFAECTALETAALGDSIQIIKDGAFDGCTNLTSVSLPDSLLIIGNLAFRNATKLESISFPKAVTALGNAAFQCCTSLKSVTLKENVTAIGMSAFSDCSNIIELQILGDVSLWGNSAFYKCVMLEKIYINSSAFGDFEDDNYIFYDAGISGDGIVLTVGEKGAVSDGLFMPSGKLNSPRITKIVVSDGAVSVKISPTYNYWPNLNTVEMPSTVEEISYGSFNDSPWWRAKDKGAVYINDVFYGYKCDCLVAQTVEGRLNEIKPTCTEGGSYTHSIYCSECKYQFENSYVTENKLGHAEVPHEAKAPTCTEIGWDAYVTCEREGCNYTTYVQKPAQHEKVVNWKCSKCKETCDYYLDGNYIYFGEYPQTLKEGSVTITETTDERGYYLGSDGCYYAKVVADPYSSGYKFSTGVTVTDGGTYYFKVEPIRWRILSEDGETAFILCDSIIANQRYDDSSNNYKESEIRAWLKETFYETAFTELQREIILITEVDNSVYSTGYDWNEYVCEDTEDKIFLLSYREVTNSAYGLSSVYDREMQTSDYSRATGAYMNTSNSYYGNGCWRLRSPSRDYDVYARGVDYVGYVCNYSVDYSNCGVVPALQIRL